MAGNNEEEDYMSEDFLSSCVGKNDVRPGLLHSRTTKRKYNMEKKKDLKDDIYRKKMKPIEQIQKEQIIEGLATPLDSSNKGFALMQKMGYKSGTRLGKEGTGILEPVKVDLKSDRIGFGWQQVLADKKKKAQERRESKRVSIDPEKYRAHMRQQHYQKKLEGDLRKSRKSCFELDYKEDIKSPPEFWFWPSHTWPNEDSDNDYEEEEEKDKFEESAKNLCNDEESIDLEINEQLECITSYLRCTYFYCIWCCTKFEDMEDLNKHCPGSTRTDHED